MEEPLFSLSKGAHSVLTITLIWSDQNQMKVPLKWKRKWRLRIQGNPNKTRKHILIRGWLFLMSVSFHGFCKTFIVFTSSSVIWISEPFLTLDNQHKYCILQFPRDFGRFLLAGLGLKTTLALTISMNIKSFIDSCRFRGLIDWDITAAAWLCCWRLLTWLDQPLTGNWYCYRRYIWLALLTWFMMRCCLLDLWYYAIAALLVWLW